MDHAVALIAPRPWPNFPCGLRNASTVQLKMYISIKCLAAADLHDCGWNTVCCCVTVFYVSSLNMCRESPGTLFFFFSYFSIVKHLHKFNLVTYGSFTEGSFWIHKLSLEPRQLDGEEATQIRSSLKRMCGYGWLFSSNPRYPHPPISVPRK